MAFSPAFIFLEGGEGNMLLFMEEEGGGKKWMNKKKSSTSINYQTTH